MLIQGYSAIVAHLQYMTSPGSSSKQSDKMLPVPVGGKQRGGEPCHHDLTQTTEAHRSLPSLAHSLNRPRSPLRQFSGLWRFTVRRQAGDSLLCLQVFLWKYQTDTPMVPFICENLMEMIKGLLLRILKLSVVGELTSKRQLFLFLFTKLVAHVHLYFLLCPSFFLTSACTTQQHHFTTMMNYHNIY